MNPQRNPHDDVDEEGPPPADDEAEEAHSPPPAAVVAPLEPPPVDHFDLSNVYPDMSADGIKKIVRESVALEMHYSSGGDDDSSSDSLLAMRGGCASDDDNVPAARRRSSRGSSRGAGFNNYNENASDDDFEASIRNHCPKAAAESEVEDSSTNHSDSSDDEVGEVEDSSTNHSDSSDDEDPPSPQAAGVNNVDISDDDDDVEAAADVEAVDGGGSDNERNVRQRVDDPATPVVLRRSNRNRSGSHRQRSGVEVIPDQAPNAPGLLIQAATIPDCVDWFDDDQYSHQKCSDVHHVRIDNVNPNQVTQIFQQILSQVNQNPRLHHRVGEVVVEPDEISPLPYYDSASAVLKKVLLIYVPAEYTIVGFIICGLLPHPNNNRTPPEDHHDPPTTIPGSAKQYTGFGSDCGTSVTHTTSSCVKEELFHAIDNVDENSITVRAIKPASEFIAGLKGTKESLTQVIQGDGDTYRVFERNGSFFKLRQNLIFAVGGNLDRYCENYGGGARFIPFNDHLLLGEHRQSYDAMSNYLEESINIYQRDPLLRGNETYDQYQQQESAIEIREGQFLADMSLRLIGSNGSKCFQGEVDRIAYVAAVSSRLVLDIGEDGGICDLTFTVRNSTTQYSLWNNLQLDSVLGHDLCHPDHDDPDNAPPPVIVSSVERWNDLANRGVGLFNRLGEPYQEDNPEHQAFGLYCAALLIVRKMNDKYNNNAPCCFASIEPNSTGNGSHVQVLFTFHATTNGMRPEGFITYLNNATWSAGVQPKSTSTREKMAQVSSPVARGQIRCDFDYMNVCHTLLYMMKDDRSHNRSLNSRDQRSHHSQLKIGIQSGGLMISYLPHLKANYKSYFSRVHLLGSPGRRMPYHFHSHHFPPNFPEGNYKEPRAQHNSTDHTQGTRRYSVNQLRMAGGGRFGLTV